MITPQNKSYIKWYILLSIYDYNADLEMNGFKLKIKLFFCSFEIRNV